MARSDTPKSGWNVGDEANGYRWNGTSWDRVWRRGDEQNGFRFDGFSWQPIPAKSFWQRSSTWIVAGTVAVGILLSVSVFVSSANRDSGSSASGGSGSSGQDLLWIPRGFQYFESDRSLAYSFSVPEADAADCGYGDKCARFAVASQTACSGGIYVAISVVDESGTVVDRSNEITGGVRAGQIASVAIPLFGESADSYRVSEMSCLG